MDLKLDRRIGDLVFVNGECPTTTDRIDVVAQRLYIRLRTLFGEWFLNVQYGVPYLERILGHKTTKAVADSILQGEIRKERGVTEITFFASTLNRRDYSCRFRVRTDDGRETQDIPISSII